MTSFLRCNICHNALVIFVTTDDELRHEEGLLRAHRIAAAAADRVPAAASAAAGDLGAGLAGFANGLASEQC
jgi:hypothetical protein